MCKWAYVSMSYWLCARPRRVLNVCPESSIWSIDVGVCGQEGERRREGKLREGGRERETERGGLFFGFSASVIKLSHVKDRWSWCPVCVCVCICVWRHLQVQTDVTHPTLETHTHTPLSPALDSASSGASQGSYQTSAICSQSALRVGQLISSQLTPSTKFSLFRLLSAHATLNSKRSFSRPFMILITPSFIFFVSSCPSLLGWQSEWLNVRVDVESRNSLYTLKAVLDSFAHLKTKKFGIIWT